MDFRIGRVLKLLQQHVSLGIGSHHFFGLSDGALHSRRAFGENQVGSERAQHLLTFHRHGFGHHQRDGIPSRRRDERQSDAGVAAGGLDQFLARSKQSAFLGVPDHGGADTILYGVRGVSSFDLGQYSGVISLPDAVQLHQRGAADAQRIVLIEHQISQFGTYLDCWSRQFRTSSAKVV